MTQKVAFVFPGQGSQSVGMLGELAERYPLVTQTYREASDALGFDLWEMVAKGPDTDLNVPAPAQYCAANTPADTVRRAPRHSHTTRTAPVQLPLFA